MRRGDRPDQIGRFEIEDRLGHGGMGSVYLARDPHLGRRVAVKVIQADIDSPEARERFLREARSIAALNHPNIVNVYESGESEGRPYLVLEYIEGRTLAKIIKNREGISLAERLRWLEELCEGLQFAHDRGIIHRDIKPANLMIDHLQRLRILDFGIAKIVGTDHTQLSAMVGTAAYMAPEYINGEDSDHRIDLFAAGAVAYELVTQRPAFTGKTQSSVIQKVMECAPAPLGDETGTIDRELGDIVLRSLRRRPEERYQSGRDLRDAFRGVRLRLEHDARTPASVAVSSGAAPWTIPSTEIVPRIDRSAAVESVAGSSPAALEGGAVDTVAPAVAVAPATSPSGATWPESSNTFVARAIRASAAPWWVSTTVRYSVVAAMVVPVVVAVLALGGFFSAAPESPVAETPRPATPQTALPIAPPPLVPDAPVAADPAGSEQSAASIGAPGARTDVRAPGGGPGIRETTVADQPGPGLAGEGLVPRSLSANEGPAAADTGTGSVVPPVLSPPADTTEPVVPVGAAALFHAHDLRAPGAATPRSDVPAVTGLRYRILRASAAGEAVSVDPDTSFRTGDRIRLAFESSVDGFLYVAQEATNGQWLVIFPNAEINGGRNEVAKFREYVIPTDDWFRLDPPAGTDKIFVFLTRTRVTTVPELNRPVTSPPVILQASIADLRSTVRTRTLRFEKASAGQRSDGSKPDGTYVVDSDQFGNAVTVTFDITHR